MMGPIRQDDPAASTDLLDDVEIPLKNLEFTIEQYLLANGTWLDTDTRVLLAGVRDCVARVAASARTLSDNPDAVESDAAAQMDVVYKTLAASA